MKSFRRSPETWRPVDIDELEPAAWAVLRHPGSTAVTAGPGAGKTELLAQRATYLLQTGICSDPHQILAISYKRESAANLARRVAARNPDDAYRFESLTFDAFTKGIVDRFIHSLPPGWRLDNREYDIDLNMGNKKKVQNFFIKFSLVTPAPLRRGVLAIPPDRFLSDVVGTSPLPINPEKPPATAAEYATWIWWQEHYLRAAKPTVDFTMLNRLAELIVRTNPQIRRALRVTYPFVFVDEFQDTTAAQITLLKTVFGHPDLVATAVGDGKQRIMRFAGALEDAMERYQADFGAARYTLTWNFRSSTDLVTVQHHVAKRLDLAVTPAVSKAATEPEHSPVEIWSYSQESQQAAHLAEWIARDISSSGRTAADFALIVRQKVADFEPALTKAFARHGIVIRNDDTFYGKFKLQDLLKHEVTRFILGLMTLAIHPWGYASVWAETFALFKRINGGMHSDEAERRLSDELDALTTEVAEWLRTNACEDTEAPDLIQNIVGLIGVTALAGFVRGKNAGDDLTLILDALIARILDVKNKCREWSDLIEAIEAKDSIALMTIHRSKGLEYHTVVLLGLDEHQWWSYSKDWVEATSVFFVGLSRAAHRVIFTTTSRTGRSGAIKPLFDLLDAVGAVEKYWG